MDVSLSTGSHRDTMAESPAMKLNNSTSITTCLSNHYGFILKRIETKQLTHELPPNSHTFQYNIIADVTLLVTCVVLVSQ